MLTTDCKNELKLKPRIAMVKEAINKNKDLFNSSIDLEMRKRLVE